MARRRISTRTPSRGERARLRAAVLNLGSQLGWPGDEVIAFGEALTGCPWLLTRRADLEVALPEYLILFGPKLSRGCVANTIWRTGEDDTVIDRNTDGGCHAARD